MADDAQAVQEVILRYHQAITNKDADGALACLGVSYLVFGKQEGRWGGRFRENNAANKEEFRAGIARMTSGDRKYTNSIDILDININNPDKTAVVRTKETGSGGGDFVWEGVTNLWILSEEEGGWKIVGSGHFIPE